MRNINCDIIDIDESADNIEFLMQVDENSLLIGDVTIVDGPNGIVEYDFKVGETAIPDDEYDAEFRVGFNDGPTLFWPLYRTLFIQTTTGVG